MNPSRRRGPYKQYLSDKTKKVPRETLRRWAASGVAADAAFEEEADTPPEAAADTAPGDAAPTLEPTALLGNEPATSSLQTATPALDDRDDGDRNSCSSSQESEDATNGAFSKEPHPCEHDLYEGSSFTNVEACLVLLTLFFKFRLTRECLGQLLCAISNFLPSPNSLPNTTYKFFKLLSHFQRGSGVHSHFFCLHCHEYLEEEISVCPNCGQACKKKGSFLQMQIADTLRSFLEDDQIYKFFS